MDQVRKADALLLVIKLFKDEFDSDLTPLADIENISYELLLLDLDLLERRIERINSNKKKNKMLSELHLLERLQTALEKEQPLSSVELNAEEQEIMKTYQFLTNKPLLVCLNLDESYLSDSDYPEKNEIKAYADDHDLAIVELSAGIELEIAELEQQEKNDFYRDLGIAEPGLIRIIQVFIAVSALTLIFVTPDIFSSTLRFSLFRPTPLKTSCSPSPTLFMR